jgi:hypothetical protein
MSNNIKSATGFDSHIHFRAPSDLMPAIHAYARRRGFTSASWIRSVIVEALERGGAYSADREVF